MKSFGNIGILFFMCLSFLAADCYQDSSLLSFLESRTAKLVKLEVTESIIRKSRSLHHLTKQSVVLKTVKISDLKIILKSQDNLFLKHGLKSEWISLNGNSKSKTVTQCDYFRGRVKFFKSISVLTLCGDNAVRGFVKIEDNIYYIEPYIHKGKQTSYHIIYKSDTHVVTRFKRDVENIFGSPSSGYNLTGDIIDIGTDLPRNGNENNNDFLKNEILQKNKTTKTNYQNYTENIKHSVPGDLMFQRGWHRDEYYLNEIGYFYDASWSSSLPPTLNSVESQLPIRWLEMAIAVDYTLIDFHGRDKVEQYVLSLLNIVSAIYQDPSLSSSLTLAVTKLLFYPHANSSVVRVGNPKKSLENANNWNNRLHASLAIGEPHHDIAIWLTRLDIGGPSGYAPVSGVCDPSRSCTLNRDEGLSSAFIIAHEMAHILGLSHDGDQNAGNNCSQEALEGSVMAPMVAATFNKFFWSPCSRNEYRDKIRKWKCLSNFPNYDDDIKLNNTIDFFFSMDEQCRMEFGDGYLLCQAFDIIEPCTHLWCGHVKNPYVCKTKKGPPLEGTHCGLNKRCINGYCDDAEFGDISQVPIVLNPQKGGWSEWSEWKSCTKSCGIGVQFRTRNCNNPEPSFGGEACNGSNEEWRSCNTQKCPNLKQDFRALQCTNLASFLDFKHSSKRNLTWLPYESDKQKLKCKLTCVSAETKELYLTNENLIDGTLCSYDDDRNICVQGRCQSVGCDGVINSTKAFDLCGVCGGNNSECVTFKTQKEKKLKRELTRLAVLPRLSKNISLEISLSYHGVQDTPVLVILKKRANKKYTVLIPHLESNGQILEGAKFNYKKTSTDHKIWASGPLLAEIIVLAYSPLKNITKNGNEISLFWITNYTINIHSLKRSKRFRWIKKDWGPCSASCGGGTRQRTVGCYDKENFKFVKGRFCKSQARPYLESKICNTFTCNFQWWFEKWESCNATCGSRGVQFREAYCVPEAVLKNVTHEISNSAKNHPWKFMVKPTKCSHLQPLISKECNRLPCLSHWQYDQWSQCSVSCGKGVSYRLAHCLPPNNETFYTCGEFPKPPVRTCNKNFGKRNSLCKRRTKCYDKSVYCTSSLFSKYCKIKQFKKLCCHSCKFL